MFVQEEKIRQDMVKAGKKSAGQEEDQMTKEIMSGSSVTLLAVPAIDLENSTHEVNLSVALTSLHQRIKRDTLHIIHSYRSRPRSPRSPHPPLNQQARIRRLNIPPHPHRSPIRRHNLRPRCPSRQRFHKLSVVANQRLHVYGTNRAGHNLELVAALHVAEHFRHVVVLQIEQVLGPDAHTGDVGGVDGEVEG